MITPVDEQTASTLAAVARFNAAFDRHDVDGVMAASTEDCIFENTGPAPDGKRYTGAVAVRWSAIIVVKVAMRLPLVSSSAAMTANRSAASSSHARLVTTARNCPTTRARCWAPGLRRTPYNSSARVTLEMHRSSGGTDA